MSRLSRLGLVTVLAVSVPVCVAAGDRVTVVGAGDVADLYAKVNAEKTAGHTLLLSGTYVLDPALGDEAGPATRGGYLDLGDRSLVGTNVLTDLDGDGVPDAIGWDASSRQPIFVDPGAETFIDGSGIALDPPGQKIIVEGQDGFRSLPFNRPLIRAPEGNTVQGVTVRWNVGPLTLGTINIQGGHGGRVRDCVVENGDMGIVMSLPGLQHDGDVLTATVTGNVTRNHVRHGIGVFNLGNRGSRIQVYVTANRSEGNGAGLTSGNISTDDSAIGVLSRGNVYAANGTGIFVPGTAVFGDPAVATDGPSAGNRTHVTSADDTVVGNEFGVSAIGGLTFPAANTVEDNTTSLTLVGTRFEGNLFLTIEGYAAVSFGGPTPGSGNELQIKVRRASFAGGGGILALIETPGNEVEIVGSEASWTAANADLPLPEGDFSWSAR